MEHKKNYSVEGGGKGMLILHQGPYLTKSGYGAHSRDCARSIRQIYPLADHKFISLK